ncbi:MAG: hypothetical protein ACRDY1_15745 [Acidimicrobiales bacterium]
MAGKGSRGRPAGGTSSGGKRPAPYRMADTTLDGTLPEWPPEPPRAPRTAVEAARLALIATPGEVHQLAWKLNDVGRASQIALAFRRARPSTLDPTATGRFEARAFFDPESRKWRVAARYVSMGEG